MSLRYDYWCLTCRPKGIQGASAGELKRRVDLQLMTIAQYEKEKHRRYKNRSLAGTENLKKRFTVSWERPERSARMAKKILESFPYDTPEKTLWYLEMVELVKEAQAEIQKLKTTYKLPENKLLFWYDVVNGMSTRLRALVDKYPDGPDKSPIQVM